MVKTVASVAVFYGGIAQLARAFGSYLDVLTKIPVIVVDERESWSARYFGAFGEKPAEL